jgi:hypothetical protein
MYTAEQVKAYLTHQDDIISNAAIQYFAETFHYADGIMESLLDKLEQVPDPDTMYLHLAYPFPQTSDTVQRITNLLTQGTIKGSAGLHLQQILLHAPAPLLKTVSARLNTLQDETGVKAEEHIRIGQLGAEELRELLNQMLEASKGLDYADLEFDYLEYLVNEAVRTSALSPEYVIETLNQVDPEETDDYRAVYYVQAAGKMQLSAAVPLLIEYLGSANDLLAEQACDALVRIGSKEIVDHLAERYAHEQDDYFKLYAADCLGRIPVAEAEPAVLSLLQQERNLTHVTKLAAGLCLMGSKSSIPVVAQLIEVGYDDEYLDLREPLYINCIMNNIELPQLTEWRKTFL